VKTQIVNFQKSYGNNHIHKGHLAAKYLDTAKIQEMQQYLADMKNYIVGNLNKNSKVVTHHSPGKDAPSSRLSSDPLLGGNKEPKITEAQEKLGELNKGDVYDLFHFVQRSVEGKMTQIAQETVIGIVFGTCHGIYITTKYHEKDTRWVCCPAGHSRGSLFATAFKSRCRVVHASELYVDFYWYV
jgi:hypothetical protein